MNIITETKGRAAEYAPLQLNLYTTCTHGCTYCYCPGALHKTPEEFHCEGPPKKDALFRLAIDCTKMAENEDQRMVQLSFIGDPYQSEEAALLTHKALVMLGEHGINTTVLTKRPLRAMKDSETFKKYDIRLGVSLVWVDDHDREKYEPNTEDMYDRLAAIADAHFQGIKTWLSIEPVIDPLQVMRLLLILEGTVDHCKIGIIQHDKKLVAAHDWRKFYIEVIDRLEYIGIGYYIKDSLRKYAPCNTSAS